MASCASNDEQANKKSNKISVTDTLEWSEIEIHLDKQVIRVEREEDTARSHTWDTKDVMEKPGVISHEPINQRDTIFVIKKYERDSLAKYVYDALQHPVFTNRQVSCYAGNVYFRIKKGNTSLSCSYYSVGDWTNVSPTVAKIYKLLRAKTDIYGY